MKEKRSVVVSLGGHKGGIGKSLLSTLLALYIKDKTNSSVIAIDADDKQNTIASRRKFELKQNKDLDQDNLFDLNVYSSLEAGQSIIDNEMGLYDYIIIDFPGNMSAEGVAKTYNLVDIIFIPINPVSFVEVDSILKFCRVLLKDVDPKREKNGFDKAERFFVYNQVDSRVKEFRSSEETNRLKEETPFPVLDGMMPRWKYLQENYQTLAYPDLEDEKRQRVIDRVMSEMYNKCEEVFNKLNK